MHPKLIILDLLSQQERNRDSEAINLQQLTSQQMDSELFEINSKETLFSILDRVISNTAQTDTVLHICAHGAVVDSDPQCSGHSYRRI